MAVRRSRKGLIIHWATIFNLVGVPVAIGIAYAGMAAWQAASQIATKPYVDAAFTESHRYTDERVTQTLKDAFEHSDRNRAEVILKMEQMSADSRASMAAVSTKVDLVLNAVQNMRNEAWHKSQK